MVNCRRHGQLQKVKINFGPAAAVVMSENPLPKHFASSVDFPVYGKRFGKSRNLRHVDTSFKSFCM